MKIRNDSKVFARNSLQLLNHPLYCHNTDTVIATKESVSIPHEDSCSKIVSLDLQESRHWRTHQQLIILPPIVFEKLVLCRGLKFAIPQQTPSRDIQASFEKAYWKLEQLLLSDSKKDLACATLRSIALNYIVRRSPTPPKALLQAINNLKHCDDIVITKPKKGSGVVVMDKADYLRLLCDASVRDSTKFTQYSTEHQKARGRPPKHYHPLLEKENELNTKVHSILPKSLADSICLKGSRLAHLCGLLKTQARTVYETNIIRNWNLQLSPC